MINKNYLNYSSVCHETLVYITRNKGGNIFCPKFYPLLIHASKKYYIFLQI